jgi:hypothetical protein
MGIEAPKRLPGLGSWNQIKTEKMRKLTTQINIKYLLTVAADGA